MEQIKAAISTMVSIGSSVFAWISLQNAKDMTALAASGMAGIAAYFSIRYYYYATKEKKQNLKIKE